MSIVQSLPTSVPEPDFVVEDDEAIALDWILGKTQTISVSIYANGRIGYAWLDGTSSGYAVSKIVAGKIPPILLQQIREVTESRA